MHGRLLALACALTASLAVAIASAPAKTSHAGWPDINGMLLMNKRDQSRPLDGRPGQDPFDGTDPTYSCDGLHRDTSCVGLAAPCVRGIILRGICPVSVTVPDVPRHNELLGGHGNDTIHAGPWGDVIWGDYKSPSDGETPQPTTQVDQLYGGDGKDFIYASHGENTIYTGAGADVVHAHFGHGSIHCGSAQATVFISRRSRPGYKLYGCKHVSYKTAGS
jgi:RTX calcium-binding nonapeptide repeat (4 copies)